LIAENAIKTNTNTKASHCDVYTCAEMWERSCLYFFFYFKERKKNIKSDMAVNFFLQSIQNCSSALIYVYAVMYSGRK